MDYGNSTLDNLHYTRTIIYHRNLFIQEKTKTRRNIYGTFACCFMATYIFDQDISLFKKERSTRYLMISKFKTPAI
jgi:hypothetical protein